MRQQRDLRPLAIVLAICASALVMGATALAIPAEITSGTRAALLKQARTVAAKEGDSHPYDIQAVRTTRLKALRRLQRGATAPSCETTPSCANAPVYVLAMRGHFSCNTCSPPPGAGIGPGSVITLEIEATDPLPRFGRFQFGNRYPNLKAVGLPVRLDARPTGRSGQAR